jgi:hypothetical protein
MLQVIVSKFDAEVFKERWDLNALCCCDLPWNQTLLYNTGIGEGLCLAFIRCAWPPSER